METIRAFIAIEPSLEVKNELVRIIDILKRADGKVKWVTPENMHLTLKFIGNIKEDEIVGINKKIEAISGKFRSFEFDIDSIGSFPDWRSSRVVWVGIDRGQKRLKTLVDSVEAGMEELGFEKEKQEFKAHLTLGRVKYIKNKKQFEQIAALIKVNRVSTRVSGISLFKSMLMPKGVIYTKLSLIKL